MKLKIFLIVFTVVIVLISSSIVLYPYEAAESRIGDLNTNAFSPGSTFLYEFSVDRNNYTNLSNSAYQYVFPTGLVYLRATGNGFVMLDEVYNSMMTSHYTIIANLSFTNQFLKVFLNNYSISSGGFIRLGEGLAGMVSYSKYSYFSHVSNIPAGATSNMSGLFNNFVFTSPLEVGLTGVNETGISYSSLHYWLSLNPNGFAYDHSRAGNNILVRGFITGYAPFLSMIFNSSNIRYSVDFNIFLVGTNVGLHPVDKYHYMTEFIGLLPVLWIVSSVFVYLTIRSARKRQTGKKRSGNGR